MERDLYLFDCICLPIGKYSGNLKLRQLYRKHSHFISTDFLFVEIRSDGSPFENLYPYLCEICLHLYKQMVENGSQDMYHEMFVAVLVLNIFVFLKKVTCGKLQLRATPPPSSAVKLRQSSPECRPVNTSWRNHL